MLNDCTCLCFADDPHSIGTNNSLEYAIAMTVMNLFPDAGEPAGVDEATAGQKPQCQDELLKLKLSITRDISDVATESQARSQDDGLEQKPLLLQRIGDCSCLVRTSQCLIRLTEKWPKTYTIVFKVIIPLISLIVVSMIFGYWLARIEAPEEIKKNNFAIAVRESLFHASQVERIIMREGPLFCVKLYFDERLGLLNDTMEDYMLRELDVVNQKLYSALRDGIKLDEVEPSLNTSVLDLNSMLGEYDVYQIDDIPQFLEVVANCGEEIDEMMNHTSVAAVLSFVADEHHDTVSFNWIKCPVLRDNETYAKIADGDSWMQFVEMFRLEGAGMQHNFVVNRWREDLLHLYDKYYFEYQKYPNMTLLEARNKAIFDAFEQADGFDSCLPDTLSATWFWFVVMTTVGYGNASPVTDEGRAMVFIFGFLCILLFGMVLAKAGDLITKMFDNGVRHYSLLKWLSIPWVAMVFWGILFYVWMAALAATTVAWKKARVGDDMEFNDAYWFAFNSITTVGLGDVFIDSEAIAAHDVVGFAMLFLIGFVLLANFLTMLRELLGSTRQTNDNVTLSDRLE